jgi:tetratricopeptide (TPR) repeat protein
MISEEKKKVLDLFAQGRKLYKLMQFSEARECFAKALESDPSDGPSKVYLERCAYYLENPPPEDWDGVFTMTTK